MSKKKIVVKGKTNNKKKKTTNKKQNNKKVTKKIQMDQQTLEILAGIFVIGIIVSLITLGLLTTLIIVLGLSIIMGITYLVRRVHLKKGYKTTLNVLTIVFLALAIVIAAVGTMFLVYVAKTAPDFDPNLLITQESSILYDKNGVEITKLGAKLRENVDYKDLPQVLVDAIISTEDSRFFQHNGFDAPRFLKASVAQVTSGGGGGASTLSMQVVKNSYTDGSLTSGLHGIIRKFTDIYLAVFKLEKNYTKEQIIEFYVNNHLMGMNNWGVEQASQSYFGKTVSDLNLAEASMIAGLFQSPNAYYPFKYPEDTKARQLTVLKLMKRHGYITEEQRKAAADISIESLLHASNKKEDAFQGYVDTVVEELEKKYDLNPYVTPLLIYTNMDRTKQAGFDDLFKGVTHQWVNDVVQGAAAAIENETGKIVAIGAGRNRQGVNSYNMATMINRQIGSTAKPLFDYGPGIEYLNWSTYEQFKDEPWKYTSGPSINNADGAFLGELTMRRALELSRNIPALKAFQQINNKDVVEFVTNLGLKPELQNGYMHEAHALGAFNGASPLELAAAYAAFGNGGYYIEPYSVSKIVYRENGNEITHTPEKVRAMSDSTAYMVTDMLKTTVHSGLSRAVRMNGVNLAAKTGTTNFDLEYRRKHGYPADAVPDGWLSGYDPEYSLTVWYGYKDNKDGYARNVESVLQREAIFRTLSSVLFNRNNKDFKMPNSVVKVGIEIGSSPALLPSDSTPADRIIYELFKKGTEPTETSSSFKKLSAPSHLSVSYVNNKAIITWDKVKEEAGNESYGDFGYQVYKDGQLLGFTTKNVFEYQTNSPEGTYSVITTFEKFSNNKSSPATFEFDNSPYTITLNTSGSITIGVGENIVDKLPHQYPIKVIRNIDNVNITSQVANSTYVTIENNVDNTTPNTTSTYVVKVNYEGIFKVFVINVKVQ